MNKTCLFGGNHCYVGFGGWFIIAQLPLLAIRPFIKAHFHGYSDSFDDYSQFVAGDGVLGLRTRDKVLVLEYSPDVATEHFHNTRYATIVAISKLAL